MAGNGKSQIKSVETQEVLGSKMTRRRRVYVNTDLLSVSIEAEDGALPISDPLAGLTTSRARWDRELTALCNDMGWEWNGVLVERAGGTAEFEKQVMRYRKGKGPQMNVVAGVARLFNDEPLPEVFRQYHGVGWYLAKMLQLADRIERLLRSGEARQAVASAIELGQLDCELALKATMEKTWHTGERTREGGKKGRHLQLGFPGVFDKEAVFLQDYRKNLREGKLELVARKLATKTATISDRYARKLRKKL